MTALATAVSLACPMCFGAADSTQVQAAKVGVIVLLAVVVVVLGGIAFVARTWAKRARLLERSADSSPARLGTAVTGTSG